jgi:hypothetical protein
MKDYFYLHKSWFRKCKGFPTVFKQIIESNSKRQMNKEEGLLFIRLMKKTYNSKRRMPSCLNAG